MLNIFTNAGNIFCVLLFLAFPALGIRIIREMIKKYRVLDLSKLSEWIYVMSVVHCLYGTKNYLEGYSLVLRVSLYLL